MTAFLARAHALRLSTFALGLAALVGSAVLPTTGCDPAEEPSCLGYLEADGDCVPKCDPSKCLAGNVCVENGCRLTCTSHGECIAGGLVNGVLLPAQSCTATTDDAGAAVAVCLETGHQPPATGLAQGQPCPFGDGDCATKACANGLECDPTACGGKPEDCVKDAVACGDKELCNIGTCTSDGSRCTVTTCPASECKALSCNSAGEGDTRAYCMLTDCASDDQCGSGFYCGYVRDPHDVCGETCSDGKCSDGRTCAKDGDCQKGNNAFCGKTLEPCVDPKAKPAGTTFEEGPLCMMRRACLRRDECRPCATNLDCSAGDGDLCLNLGVTQDKPALACAHLCTDDSNCRPDQACVAVGGNTCTATPGVFCTTAVDCPTKDDTCLPRNICRPRSGGCNAEGAGEEPFCFACVSDLDCGGPDSSWGCAELGNGERACFDQSFSKTCTKDSECPKSPGGAFGTCLDENDGVNQGDDVYHRCYFPAKKDGGQVIGYSCFP
ncbi:MAG: hypothetical protein FJ095_00775 [Deltaproteobacteria bacterium]|nr:hypothetical protein [Deltaproteobacteria bacterium]